MGESHDVSVDLDRNVVFPEVCVVCNKPCSATISVRANPDGWHGYWKWIVGATKRYGVPCHAQCSKSLKVPLLRRNIVLLAIATAAIPVVVHFDLPLWLVALLAFVLLTPPIVWQRRRPPPIEFMRMYDKMEFSFKDEAYAREFALLNDSVVNEEE